MECKLRKPNNKSVKQTVAATIKMNSALPHFPDNPDGFKFPPEKLLNIFEWMLPETHRSHFDKKGCIPADKDCKRFVEEAKIVERLLEKKRVQENNQSNDRDDCGNRNSGGSDKGGNHGQSNGSNRRQSRNGKEKKFFCTEHGHNSTHDANECCVSHPHLRPNRVKEAEARKEAAKEVNAIAKAQNKSKKEATALKMKEHEKAQAASEKSADFFNAEEASDMGSEDENNLVDLTQKIPRKKVSFKKRTAEQKTSLATGNKKKRKQQELQDTDSECSEEEFSHEELAFQKQSKETCQEDTEESE